jgi:hypothetical protein
MQNIYDGRTSLGQQIFGTAELGDQRRTRRLVQVFDQCCQHPGGTLPDKMQSPADLKGLYRLCEKKQVTHEAILRPAREHTLRRLAEQEGTFLILHDGTELDYTSLESLAGELGQIGEGHGRGYECHNSLAVNAQTREVLGLVGQILHHRVEAPDEETLPEHRDRDSRESLLWLHGTQHLPRDWRLVDVCDQGADTFEFLEHEVHSGRRFVIRAKHSRKIHAGHEPRGATHELKPYARSLPVLGTRTIDIQAQKGPHRRKARKGAVLSVRATPILVRRPHAKYGHHGNDPLAMWVVCVREENPPRGEKPIEWMLLTNEPVNTVEDALRVIDWYRARWIIEEYHKAMKTGCQVEDMQFTATSRLEPAIALLSVVATTLLNLREASRQPDAHTRLAATLFAQEYIEVLAAWRFKEIRTNLTVHEFFFALARLGGHQNRKHDHRPGWLVLWRGWIKLQAMQQGYLAAIQTKCG